MIVFNSILDDDGTVDMRVQVNWPNPLPIRINMMIVN